MKTTSYEGKQVFIGLDVHRECFVASCSCEGVVVRRCRMPKDSGGSYIAGVQGV